MNRYTIHEDSPIAGERHKVTLRHWPLVQFISFKLKYDNGVIHLTVHSMKHGVKNIIGVILCRKMQARKLSLVIVMFLKRVICVFTSCTDGDVSF